MRSLVPASWRERLRRARYHVADLADRWYVNDAQLLPPPSLQFVGSGDFEAVGEQFLGYFRDLGGLRPDDRVLDVGCGIGRMAIPLTRYLSAQGSYDGFDIVPHGIAWCSRRISKRFANFRFRLVAIRNSDYNPHGHIEAARFTFPYPDGAFDFVFLTSVFTHMLPEEVDNYLKETARVLAPGGRCFITWFLLTDESRRLIAQGKSTLPFAHALGDCLTTDATVRERAIAYDEGRVHDMYAASHLRLKAPAAYGSWSGRSDFLTYQDVVVAHRDPPSANQRHA